MFNRIGKTLARIFRKEIQTPTVTETREAKPTVERARRVVTKRGRRMARSPGHPPAIPEGNW